MLPWNINMWLARSGQYISINMQRLVRQVSLNNNILEREAVKPYATQENLFSGSPAGADSTSMFFSLIATAKEHGLNPHMYLNYIVEMAPHAKSQGDWESLLLWNGTIPKKLVTSYIVQMMNIGLPS